MRSPTLSPSTTSNESTNGLLNSKISNDILIVHETGMNIVEEKPASSSCNPIKTAPKRAKSTFPFGKCKVCNDKATGVHYGVASCEGCKVMLQCVS